MHDSYFNVRIDGCLYGLWKIFGAHDGEFAWKWEPVDRSSTNKYTPETNARIQAIAQILEKCSNYAGLTPEQLVQSLL